MMTDLTPEKRAKLREGIGEGRWLAAAELLALLDAADERDKLAAALVRAQGPFACCSHCKEDKIHDVETNGHEVPCTKCQASVGEVERLRSERDRVAAAEERVRALHRPVGIYDECDCPDLAKAEGHLDVYEVGITCNKLYEVCAECCCDDGYQTEDCAIYHEHKLGETHHCPTIRTLDGQETLHADT